MTYNMYYMLEIDLSRDGYYNEVSSHRPGKDKYLSARAFELLPYIYGDIGRFVVDFYTYFRWVDDIADSSDFRIEERLEFINRQRQLIEGNIKNDEAIYEVERFFLGMKHNLFPDDIQQKMRRQFLILIQSIHDDVCHFGWYARTRREVRFNNLRTLLPYAEVISLALNGRTIRSTSAFIDFADSWNYLGALLHLPKDLGEEQIVKIGFTPEEVAVINAIPEADGRRKMIQTIYTRDRYRREWKNALGIFWSTCRSFRKLNIPIYQRLISELYLSTREPARLPKEFRLIEKSLQH